MGLTSSAVVFSNFKVSMAQETVEGGRQDSGGRDGFLRCIVIKASQVLQTGPVTELVLVL